MTPRIQVAIKVKIPRRKKARQQARGFSRDPVIRIALATFVVLGVIISAWFSYYYIKYDRIIEQRFKGPVFSSSAKIYAIPHLVKVDEKIEPREIAAQLQRAGYSENGNSPIGSYRR